MSSPRRAPRSLCRSLFATVVSLTMVAAPSMGMAAEPAPPVQSPGEEAPPVQTPTPPVQAPSEPPPSTEPAAPPVPVADPAPTETPAVAVESLLGHEGLILDGESLIAQGRPADGAQRLSEAYIAMPIELRVAEPGQQVVARASEAYQHAGSNPAQLEAEHALLTAYFADRGEARAAGRPIAGSEAVEQHLGDRLTAVEQALGQRNGTPGGDELGPIDGRGPAVPPPNPRARLVAQILIGTGVVGVVAGGVLVGVGATAASRAERQRPLAEGDEVSQLRQAKLSGTLMATFGALIFSGSVMMLGVGTNRLSEIRERSGLSLVPMRRGLALTGRF